MKNFKIGDKIVRFINNGGWRDCIALGIAGIVLTIIAIYGRCGFNIWRFIFTDLPLFSFCGWALYKAFKLIKDNPDIFK